MPELPEVETVRRALEPRLTGRTIGTATVRTRLVIAGPNDPQAGFYRQRTPTTEQTPARLSKHDLLSGATIDHLRRHGKQLAIIATDRRALVIGLGMTGHLTTLPPARTPYPDHTHAVWTLDTRDRLIFTDPRRFGLVRLIPQFDPDDVWAALGPDALNISAKALGERLTASHAPIKARLLNQAAIAGIGNIYADEALHAAGIHPLTPSSALTPAHHKALASAIRASLRAAVRAGGSTIRDYRSPSGDTGTFQTRHAVYGRGGQPCHTCRGELASIQAAGRTTVFCPVCQPLTRS